MGRNAAYCENLYEPNPDIAGRGVVIVFLVHTSSYIFLGLVIAPIVEKFLAQLTPRQLAAVREHRSGDGASGRASSEHVELLNNSSETRDSSSSGKVRPPGSSEAIMAVFTSQYIVGLAYIVVAFTKHKTMSYYHLRIIWGLCSINMAVALVHEYSKSTLIGPSDESSSMPSDLRGLIRRTIDMQPRMCISSLGLVVLTISYGLFLAYTSRMRARDTNFQACFPADKVLFPIKAALSVCIMALFLVPIIVPPKIRVAYRMLAWAVYLVASMVLIILHYVQLIYIMRAFRGPTGRMNPELEFGFGQLLMFFMILQLFIEFGIGLWSDLNYLHRYLSGSGSSVPRSFVIFCSILLPMLPGKLRQEILQTLGSVPKRIFHKSKQGISSLSRILSGWVHTGTKKPLKKTRTIENEAGPDDSSSQVSKSSTENGSIDNMAPMSRPNSQERPSSDESDDMILPVLPTVPRLTLE